MNKKTLIYGFVGLFTSSAIATEAIATSTQAQSSRSRHQPHHIESQRTPAQRGTSQQSERHFIEMMIPHHQDAVEMADLALSRAKRPEIKRLAQAIKTDQNREIQQMRTWYRQWYRTEVPAHHRMGQGTGGDMDSMHSNMGSMEMDLTALRNASDFDREFIRQMIPHHQEAVRMAQMVLNRARRPEIRNLAQSIIRTQNTEIRQMQQWEQAWYR
ncbi:MAG TPA: DUF305 domain-containing protein [Cyanobacteria bacterium UBA8553]|nr:DUF305 domain-containing protein [Cyanobacteria bacterium UBA8553]